MLVDHLLSHQVHGVIPLKVEHGLGGASVEGGEGRGLELGDVCVHVELGGPRGCGHQRTEPSFGHHGFVLVGGALKIEVIIMARLNKLITFRKRF